MRYYQLRYYSPSLGGRVVRYSAQGKDGEVSVTVLVERGAAGRDARTKALDRLEEPVDAS